ncbi:MAG: SufD family Fe-S cluster assembly protein [Dehalococcoidia bacterium]|nr:SufD family Fe-S cluster assembly protein [Dehalococcoidia bacterium]
MKAIRTEMISAFALVLGFVALNLAVTHGSAQPSASPSNFGPWQQGPDLPRTMYNHGMFAAKGYLYVLGGTSLNGIVANDLGRVYSAQILPDGSIGANFAAMDIRPGSMGRAIPGIGAAERRGLILADDGTIHAIPELLGRLPDVDLSHEAAVGKIAEEKLEYLMARGLTRAEATAMIAQGFLNADIKSLPPQLEAELKRAIKESQKKLF